MLLVHVDSVLFTILNPESKEFENMENHLLRWPCHPTIILTSWLCTRGLQAKLNPM